MPGPAAFRGAGSLLLLLFALAVLPSSVSAQAVYGSIGGTVTDPSGGVLPGVTVTITSLTRQTTDTVVTNESGLYVKERLLPGAYKVEAELTGFKQAVVRAWSKSASTRRRPWTSSSQVGQLTEEVTVTGGATLLKTDRADVATRFDARQLTDLPVLDRNFTKFLLLTPGTQQLQWQHAASENPQGSTQTMVNGQHFSGTGYQLDGTENRDPILGIIVINPDARIDRRDQDHLAELRRRVRPGGRRRGVGADASRAATRCAAAPSSSSRTTRCRRATRSRSSRPTR